MEFFKQLKNILFLDIETVSCVPEYAQLDERLKPLWNKKALTLKTELPADELFNERAAIYSEFGKIITIATGFFSLDEKEKLSFRVKGLSNDNERTLLIELNDLFSRFNQRKLILCAHNGKEFDFPYICRRMLVNGVPIPEVLQISGKKPWEVRHEDTMELWKFGDRKAYTALELLAALFGIPQSKGDFDGGMVNKVYYEEKNLKKINDYCIKDVIMTAQVYLKLNGWPLVEEENIYIR